MSASPPSDDEQKLFRELMQDVRPIKQDKADLGKKPPPLTQEMVKHRRAVAQTSQSNWLTDGLSDGQVQAVEPSQPLSFHVPDLPARDWEALRRGRIAWQEGLDCHGYTLEQARAAVFSFIQEGYQRGLRCLLLVHGKAYNRTGETPSIKSHVNAWLRQIPQVLAFVSAQPADGGTGAVYLLLRNSRKQSQKNRPQ